jgi:hypothetical protein
MRYFLWFLNGYLRFHKNVFRKVFYYFAVTAYDVHGNESNFSDELCYNVCGCDLNSDGSCDGLDWMLFYPGWGRNDCDDPDSEPCECDLNNDGSCNGLDWMLFYPDWGREDCGVCG